MLLLDIDTRSPSFNLALEEALFSSLRSSSRGLFLLWQNDPAIIIGRHQVAEAEANLKLAQNLNIPYFRRISGGGAVYHDQGNLNFSFIEPADSFPIFRHYLEPVRRALRETGVEAEITGRNDLEANGVKIGGCAQARRGNLILCHGCLLFDVDLDPLSALLSPSRAKLKKHGVASVHSRVGNIKDLEPSLTISDLKNALSRACSIGAGVISNDALAKAAILEKSKYLSAEWNRDRSFAGRERRRASFSWGDVEWSWNWKNGRIADSRISGDFFAKRDIASLEKALDGLSREELTNFKAAGLALEIFSDCVADEAEKFFRMEVER